MRAGMATRVPSGEIDITPGMPVDGPRTSGTRATSWAGVDGGADGDMSHDTTAARHATAMNIRVATFMSIIERPQLKTSKPATAWSPACRDDHIAAAPTGATIALVPVML
jgi:hypothetical protein